RLISVEEGRLIHAHDLELSNAGGAWSLAGVHTRPYGLLGRLRAGGTRPATQSGFIDWSGIEPFVGHVPTSRLLMPLRRLRRLHPAQIADLVEAASHDEGEEIIEAVAQDKELEADIYEELDEEHQLEFLRERSDSEVAGVLSRMESDDAADLLMELDQERRLPVLELLPASK